MGGLSSYPRSNGHTLPQRIAEAMRRYIPEQDQATFTDLYWSNPPASFLRPNTDDPNDQPGAIPKPEHLPYPSLSAVADLFADSTPVPPEQEPLLQALRAFLQVEVSQADMVAQAFSRGVRMVVLPADIRLFRIVGVVVPKNELQLQKLRKGNWRITNDPLGDWWVTEQTMQAIQSEVGLRAKLALRTDWNGDHGIVSIELPEPVAVLIGPAASQVSADRYSIFPGGGQQVYWPVRLHPGLRHRLQKLAPEIRQPHWSDSR